MLFVRPSTISSCSFESVRWSGYSLSVHENSRRMGRHLMPSSEDSASGDNHYATAKTLRRQQTVKGQGQKAVLALYGNDAFDNEPLLQKRVSCLDFFWQLPTFFSMRRKKIIYRVLWIRGLVSNSVRKMHTFFWHRVLKGSWREWYFIQGVGQDFA